MARGLQETIYPRLPVFMQNIACSFYGWSAAQIRYSSHFDEHLKSLKKSEWWDADTIRNYQDQKAREIYKYAFKHVPFYRSLFKAHGLSYNSISGVSDLTKLPIVNKETVRQHQHKMVSQAFDSKSLISQTTSGTTGTPLTVKYTRESIAYQWAIWWRHRSRFGLNPNDRQLSFTGKSMVPHKQKTSPYWRYDLFGHRVCLSVYHISDETINDIYDFLNQNSFKFFSGAASGIYILSDMLEKHGLTLNNCPDWVVSGADRLLPEFESSFRRNFNASVTEQYGMMEFAGNMSKCEAGNFHEDFECGFVEGVPIEGTPYHKLILTGWGNLAMPFIRYEVGDLGIPMSELCSCGRQSACYKSIDGRLEDYIVTPDGRRLMGMNQVMQYASNAKEIQIYQKTTDHIEFRIIANEKFGKSDIEALSREFIKRAGSGIKIDFKQVDSLERSPSGKLRAVISLPARDLKTQARTKNQ